MRVAATLCALACVLIAPAAEARTRAVTVTVGGKPLVTFHKRASAMRLTASLQRRLPAGGQERRRNATIAVRYDAAATAKRVRRQQVRRRGGRLEASKRAVASRIPAPIVAQELRNNCESAALSILLAAERRPVDQLAIQEQLPRSGTLDPTWADDAVKVWGDPEEGYVGRAEGGGPAGGFGVYQRPVAALAARLGTPLADLTGSTLPRIQRRLLAGRPVMVWVGLSDGPYDQWRGPAGQTVRINYGEHALVLYGVERDGTLLVSNPLKGTDERWSPARFEQLFQRLGRRALSP